MRILHFIFLFFFIAGSHAWAMKIGVVDLNRALNESEAGIRSKNVLETKGRQKQQEFKLEEEELRELAEELRSNPLLTPKAKEQKQQQLQQGQHPKKRCKLSAPTWHKEMGGLTSHP